MRVEILEAEQEVVQIFRFLAFAKLPLDIIEISRLAVFILMKQRRRAFEELLDAIRFVQIKRREMVPHSMFLAELADACAVDPFRELIRKPRVEELARKVHVELRFHDSVAGETGALRVRRVTLAPLLAEAIRRLHDDRSLADLLVHI